MSAATEQTKIDAPAKAKTAAPKPKASTKKVVASNSKQIFTAGTNGAQVVVTDAESKAEIYSANLAAGSSFTIDAASAIEIAPKKKRSAPEPAAAAVVDDSAQKQDDKKAKKAKKASVDDDSLENGDKAKSEKAEKKKEKKAPGEKKEKRAPSAYNLFIAAEVQRQKKANPSLDHKQAFSKAAEQWKVAKAAGTVPAAPTSASASA